MTGVGFSFPVLSRLYELHDLVHAPSSSLPLFHFFFSSSLAPFLLFLPFLLFFSRMICTRKGVSVPWRFGKSIQAGTFVGLEINNKINRWNLIIVCLCFSICVFGHSFFFLETYQFHLKNYEDKAIHSIQVIFINLYSIRSCSLFFIPNTVMYCAVSLLFPD